MFIHLITENFVIIKSLGNNPLTSRTENLPCYYTTNDSKCLIHTCPHAKSNSLTIYSQVSVFTTCSDAERILFCSFQWKTNSDAAVDSSRTNSEKGWEI